MTRTRPSVPVALAWAYWDLFQALRMLWRSALIALVILSVGAIATAIGPLLLARDPISQTVTRQGFLIMLCFLLTPFFLAVHRWVLLGEVPRRYDLDPARPRFQLLFGWLAVSSLLLSIPSFLDAVTAVRDPFYSLARSFAGAGPSTLVTSAQVAVFVMMMHLLVLFPAIAVDAPVATWQNAVSDTRSHRWFALAVIVLPFIPIGLLGMLMAPLMRMGHASVFGLIASMLWLGATLLVGLTLAAVIASRLYQAVGDRLNTPVREG